MGIPSVGNSQIPVESTQSQKGPGKNIPVFDGIKCETEKDGTMNKSDQPHAAIFKNASSHENNSVPLRQRHLPASFWKEPNRPKPDPTDNRSMQLLNMTFPGYTCSRDFTTIGKNPSNFAWRNSKRPIQGYTNGNYQPYSATLPGALCDPDKMRNFSPRTYTGPYVIPSASSFNQRQPVRQGQYESYPGARGCLSPATWGCVTTGDFSNPSLQQTLAPWRPIPFKSSAHYSVRYHPFSV